MTIPTGRRAALAMFAMLALAGCGRTSPISSVCVLAVSPAALDFGEVAPGGSITRSVTLSSSGSDACAISNLALSADGDPGFSLGGGSSLSVLPGESATVSVTFSPARVSLPLTRTGTLRFDTNDENAPSVAVPLTARIHSGCILVFSPSAIDFGHVALGGSATGSVKVANMGTGTCEVSSIAIGAGSDPEFTLAASQPSMLTLAPGQSGTIGVTFTASDGKKPHHKTGTLIFQSTDPATLNATVPLSADIDIGCDLTITPPALAFGNVILNTTVSADVTLGNDGSETCLVSGIALGAGTDPGFALAAGQPTAFAVAPGATRAIPISFTASDIAPPHLKTGTLIFRTGNSRAPDATVPLSAYVNTACVEASKWIYTVDQNGMFSRFDPSTLTFTDVGLLACPDSSYPNSMAVDQNAVAWVAYADGKLFQVDTATAACTATTFQPNQHGLLEFGMGFVFDPMTGADTLYIAGGQSVNITQSTLATLSFPGLVVTPIGTITTGMAELSGTGDGSLWGFVPPNSSSTGVSTLLQIDPTSGATLQSFPYPTLSGSNWAMKFWGGSFWIFLGQSIYQVQRTTPQTYLTAVANTGRRIVGAGVSTCAPLH